MNVIIANKYSEMLKGSQIEIIKFLEGVFNVDYIINEFSNFYFDRMILDITALENYTNLDNLQKLSINFDMTKVILLLDDNEENANTDYLSKIISMGIYNFTRNLDGVKYLLENPNSYRDVAHLHNVNSVNNTLTEAQDSNLTNTRVIGVKSLTKCAGSTTLIYMMKKHLESNYSVNAIEIDKRDFNYFEEDDMISTTSQDFPKELMKRRDTNVILVDLNEYQDTDICNDVIYLLEPSIIRLNTLLKRDRLIFKKLANSKIVLCKSNVANSDLNVFEYETGSKIFYNLPSLDERKNNLKEINGLLSKLGFAKQSTGVVEENNKNKLLGMFKF